jgi:hypothetical protein
MIKMRTCRAITASVLLVLAVCSLFLGAAYARQASHRPLSLVRGALNGYQWTVAVARDGGEKGGQRPCLIISNSDMRAPGGDQGFSGSTRSCSALPNGGAPFVLSDTTGEGSREMTVFGLAVTPKVASAYLDFGSGGHRRARLKQLNSVQQRNAGVRPLRYAALALKGDRCLRQVKGYNAKGNEIYRGPIDECSDASR